AAATPVGECRRAAGDPGGHNGEGRRTAFRRALRDYSDRALPSPRHRTAKPGNRESAVAAPRLYCPSPRRRPAAGHPHIDRGTWTRQSAPAREGPSLAGTLPIRNSNTGGTTSAIERRRPADGRTRRGPPGPVPRVLGRARPVPRLLAHGRRLLFADRSAALKPWTNRSMN